MNFPPKDTTCCFTGHRRIPANSKSAIFDKLCQTVKSLAQNGITTFVAGGALGFDTLAALAVLELRKTDSRLRLIVVIPCRDQASKWSAAAKKTYEEILTLADDVICLNDKYTPGCMHQRNQLMVKFSSVCVTYHTGKAGGTAYTLSLIHI